jgi:hypothetical protein
MKRIAAFAVVALGCLAISALPTFGADSGTVDARVSVAAPCLSTTFFGGGSGLDFGTLPFATATQNAGSTLNGNVILKNCGVAQESVAVHVTKATNATGDVWDPVPVSAVGGGTTCNAGVNKYKLGVGQLNAAGTNTLVFLNGLTETNVPFYAPAAGDENPISSSLNMPCTGSAGAGPTMNFQCIYTASL